MTRRVTVEFETEEDAQAFRQRVEADGEVIIEFDEHTSPMIKIANAQVVDEEPIPADAMRSQHRVRIGTKLYDIQRTEYKEFFLGADLEGQIDMLTIPIRELVHQHYNTWKEGLE